MDRKPPSRLIIFAMLAITLFALLPGTKTLLLDVAGVVTIQTK